MDYIKSLFNTVKGIVNYGNFKKCLSVGLEFIEYIFKIFLSILNMFLNWFIHIFTGFTSSDLEDIINRISEKNKENDEEVSKKYEDLKKEISDLKIEVTLLRSQLKENNKIDTTDNAAIIEEEVIKDD